MNQDLPAPFGKYQLEQFLGGGMAHVYRATDTVLNRTVCVKILTEEGAADGETRARFLAEAKMPAGPVHDKVIRVLDYGEEQGRPFIVMEFLTGRPQGINGRYVVAGFAFIALAVVGTFIYLTLSNKNKIQQAVKQMRTNPPVLEHPAGAMVLVQEGPFLAGADKKQQSLPAFYIDKTEVTVAAYRNYCERSGRSKPAGLDQALPDLPVTGVTFLEAKDFCSAARKRLPTALEWEKAGRGPAGFKFPWGDTEEEDRAVVGGKPLAPAASLAASTSPFGAMGMAGNAREWVDQPTAPSPSATEPRYQAKGGSHLRPLADAVLWEFISLPARFSAPDIGFRCAKDPAPVQ